MPTDTRKKKSCAGEQEVFQVYYWKKHLQMPLFSPSLCQSHAHLWAHTVQSVWPCLLQGESVTTWGGHGVEQSWALSQS